PSLGRASHDGQGEHIRNLVRLLLPGARPSLARACPVCPAAHRLCARASLATLAAVPDVHPERQRRVLSAEGRASPAARRITARRQESHRANLARLSCNGSEKGGGRPFDTHPVARRQVHWTIIWVCIDAVENGVMNESPVIDAARLAQRQIPTQDRLPLRPIP